MDGSAERQKELKRVSCYAGELNRVASDGIAVAWDEELAKGDGALHCVLHDVTTVKRPSADNVADIAQCAPSNARAGSSLQ